MENTSSSTSKNSLVSTNHYIAYHKFIQQDEEGNDHYVPYDTTVNEFEHYSNHPETRLQKAIGHTVWVIGGEPVRGRTQYTLLSCYTAEVVDTIPEVCFAVGGHGVGFTPPIGHLRSKPWFDTLRKEQSNFSLGFNQIKNQQIIAALVELAAKRADKSK